MDIRDELKEPSFVDMFLGEAGKTALPIKWDKKPKKWKGHFIIDEIDFQIIIDVENDYSSLCEYNTDVWEFKFYRDKSAVMVNDFKYPFVVVPTVKKAMEDFLKEKAPKILGFLANNEDKGRIKMYEKNAKMYSAKFDYKININKDSDFYAFILYKDNQFEECIDAMIGLKG